MRISNKMIAVVAVLLMAAVPFLSADIGSGDARDNAPAVLIDMGNGETYWATADGTAADRGGVMDAALSALGIEHSINGSRLDIDGKTSVSVKTVTSEWRFYVWTDGAWSETGFRYSEEYSGESMAFGFYPESAVPTETPDYMSSWTMIMGDSSQSGHQTADVPEGGADVAFDHTYGKGNYVNSAVLVAGDKAYVRTGGGQGPSEEMKPGLFCYDRFTGDLKWRFSHEKGAGYETATGLITDGHIYLPATNGSIYRIPLAGPGDGNKDVTSFDVPKNYDHELTGNKYSTGPSTLTYDSGAIYFGSSNGYIYCIDTDLNELWKTPIGGCVYFMAVTVQDGTVYTGALDGTMYILDASNGKIMAQETVYTSKTSTSGTRTYGLAAVPVVMGDRIYVSYSDGQGMNTLKGGVAVYSYSGGELTHIASTDSGPSSNYLLPVQNKDFTGVYFTSSKVPLGRVSSDGAMEVLNDSIEGVKAPLILVNGSTVIAVEYRSGGNVYSFGLDGGIVGMMKQPESVEDYAMAPAVVIDSWMYFGTDGGFYAVDGSIVMPEDGGQGLSGWQVASVILIVLIAAFAALCIYIKKAKGSPPIGYIRGYIAAKSGFRNERLSKSKQNKRRLAAVLVLGSVTAFLMFICCLAFGPSGTISLPDTLSALVSAISKHGQDLTFNEIIVYESRLPRAIAALAVGIGLSIAGCIYQAVIRNPLVDPYIIGVSAGAGTFAVAAIATNFTLFGLLDGSNFAIPILAIIGGLLAFALTMLIAEKAGGSSSNYVLGGVVIGLAFSSMMTIMLVTSSSSEMQGALTWLYGSFANITWNTVWIVFFPAVLLSLVSLFWAKELNLVLLGEDQAQQMGLNVRRFNRWMLILASVITSVCVAFAGIIGFVGLVVPHLCRMILGGDHRLVLPASMVVGAALMLFADLLSRMILIPLELPVGAITTMIGVPVFAYLLIRKGRMYDG